MIEYVDKIILLILLIIAIGFDIRERRIPNKLIFIGILSGLCMGYYHSIVFICQITEFAQILFGYS